jgi:transposase
MQSKAKQLLFVYCAGPCGSWRSRSLTNKGDVCWVVVLSLRPQKAGDRVKTARRGAVPLARLLRSGTSPRLCPCCGRRSHPRPEPGSRRRHAGPQGRQVPSPKVFLLQHDIRDTGQATWGPAHLRWLAAVVCATPAPPIVFPEDVRVVHEHTARLQRLAQARHAQVQPWRLQPVVEALQALRGVQCPGAVTVVAEWGALRRVDHPRQLMRDWGLTPSESSRPAVHSSQGPGRTAIPPTSVVTCNGAWRSAPKPHRISAGRRLPPSWC